ncbi:WapI family immunity protein [Nocardia asteroides]|uniref:WapI family immunity protein n=1 Tax=Nocardia asteroides TaxID=1824 RepID=UPI00365D83DC
MILADRHHRIELRPLRYQFARTSGNRYDDNWLVVHGEVRTPAGSWAFADACMLVGEAQEVSPWLRGGVGVTPQELRFLEPVLSFLRDDAGRVGVAFSQEAAPPWREGAQRLDEFLVELDIESVALELAAQEWDRQMAEFPVR